MVKCIIHNIHAISTKKNVDLNYFYEYRAMQYIDYMAFLVNHTFLR